MKSLQITVILLFLTSTWAMAQANELKARLEFEDGEKAYAEGNFDKALAHLNNVQNLLGTWNPRMGYLKILTLNRLVDYQSWDEKTEDLKLQVESYMRYASNNSDRIDPRQFREIYEIEQRIAYASKRAEWIKHDATALAIEARESRDYSKMVEYATQSAEAGNPVGMNILAVALAKGNGVEVDTHKALDWLKHSAEKGFDLGCVNYAMLLKNQEDYTEALSWLRKAADLGNADAMTKLGMMHYKGEGVKPDHAEAMKLFRIAAENGDTQGMIYIGDLYLTGQGVAADYSEGISWYTKAAEKGDPIAMFRLGERYTKGDYVTQDKKAGFDWFLKAAQLDYLPAMEKVAYAYEAGLGTNSDSKDAFDWHVKVAKAKDDDDLLLEIYAEAFYIGIIVVNEDSHRAAIVNSFIDYFERKRSFNNRLLSYRSTIEMKSVIAKAYQEGWGVPQDKKLAKKWEKRR